VHEQILWKKKKTHDYEEGCMKRSGLLNTLLVLI